MAESGFFSGRSGAELRAVKEALNVQEELLHKVYAEVDQEREASETAASEALSMILRLQGEKAAAEMEAKQYRRMAEEKMFHADECIAILEDVIYQRDMEIAALEFQIQAYKYKLLSLGCDDIECDLESIFLHKIKSLDGVINPLNSQASETTDDSVSSVSLQDIFEVSELLARTNSKACLNSSPEKELSESRDMGNLAHEDLVCAHSPISNAEQLCKRMEQLERPTNGTNSRPEIVAVGAGEFDSLKELLNTIQTQLSVIETDIESLKTTKSRKHVDEVLIALQEEMLHFWL